MNDLPRGWERLTDPHGRVYFHDRNTGTTSWTAPPPPPPLPPPADQSPTAPPLSSSDSYAQHPPQRYPPPSQGYAPHSQAYPAHNPSYATHAYPAQHPNGPTSPDRYDAPPYGFQPTSQPGYGSPSGYGQSADAHAPGRYPPQGYAAAGYGAPSAHPLPPHAHAPPVAHPPPGSHPSDYAAPPAGYAHSSPPTHPPPPGHSPPTHPLPPPHAPPPAPPQGYPSAPGRPAQPPPPHQHSLPPHQHSLPPHRPSYQPPPAQHPSHLAHVAPAPSAVSAMSSAMSHLSMAPGSKVVPISLEFRAVGLRDRDFIGKSDPVLHVLQPDNYAMDQAHVSRWKRVGSTEPIKNNTNPTWSQQVKVRYYFERHQPLRFEIVDVDNFKTMQGDHLGFAETTLAEIVRNSVVRLKVKRKTGGAGKGELTIRAHDDNPAGKVRLQLSLAGSNLDKKDFMGKSDPYYKLLRVMPGSGGTSMLYKSEEKMNDSNPTWKPHTIMIPAEGTHWSHISFAVEVFDWDKYTPHDLIGETTFALSELIRTKSFPLINKKKQAKKGSRYKNSGELLIHRADATELPSFISYLQGGLRLDFVVAVDFTASNRPVDNPQSLHYMGDPNRPSQYYQALQAVGTVLSGYLADGYITALGFGAKLRGGGDQASFDFALNAQDDARVFGVQGLLDSYNTALSSVTLSGPTYFTPIIRNAMRIAKSVPVSQTNQHFAVLLILTDGIITDLSSTVDAIIEASHSTPIAIVIVGVGKADFRAMERLDGDNFKLRSDRGDKVAKHDIVQFTKYDPTKPIEDLASEVLHEVPQRVVEFMADSGIKPNPPVGQPSTY